MHALFLLPFPEGTLRLRSNHGDKGIALPRPPWFVERLRGHGLAKLLERSRHGREHRICGVVVVSANGQLRHDGPLTPWSAEAAFQRQYYNHPADAYQVSVVHAARLEEPILLTHRRAQLGHGGFAPFALSMSSGIVYPYWEIDDNPLLGAMLVHGGQRLAIDELFGAWGLTQAAGDVPCMMIPRAIFELVMRGDFRDLLCLARWNVRLERSGMPSPFGAWPDALWTSIVQGTEEPPPVLSNIDPQRIDGVALDLRMWSDRILPPLPDADRAACEHMLRRVVTDLDGMSGALARARGDFDGPRSSSVRFGALKLVECIRLSRALRGGARMLESAVIRALSIVLPNMPFEWSVPARLTSKSTLHRYELVLDCAFLAQRAAASTGDESMHRWMWVDSSPQQGFDWVWAELRELPSESAVPAFKALLSISAAVAEMPADPDALDLVFDAAYSLPCDWDSWHAHLATMRHHVLIPTAVTIGQRTVMHKALALTHALAMESSSALDLSTALGSVKSFTSDMGAELSIPDLMVDHASDLLPPWLKPVPLEPDVEVAGQVHSGSESLEPDVEMGSVSEAGPENDIEGVAPAPTHDGQAEARVARAEFFLPNSLTIAGMQHVVDNLAKEVHRDLQGWQGFHKQLQNMECFLSRKESRDRLISTCIRDSQHAALEAHFVSWSARLYEQRWHETVSFCRELQPLLQSWRAVWSSFENV